MSTDLVLADNMAALDTMAPDAREVAVTNMLSEARSWLAHAVEASEPASIATFKAQMATWAEATKQLGLSKEIQLDAQEMVRRAERGVGQAIRKGQADGTIAKRGDIGGNAHPGVHGARSGCTRHGDLDRPAEIAGVSYNGELTPLYELADGVSDEQFDDALIEAKSEGNLSRANVVRKVRENGPGVRQQRADQITELAVQGYSSRQMPNKVGVSEETVRLIARDFKIDIPADKIVGRTRRIDHTHIVRSSVDALADLVSALNFIVYEEVDPTEAAEWATSLTESITALKRFQKQIDKLREVTHD